MDSDLEKFSATKPAEREETVSVIATETFSAPDLNQTEPTAVSDTPAEEKIEEFNNFDASSVMSEMPKASSLFKAIINNKPEDASVSAQLETALSSNENVFTAKSTVRTVEEEPELFPNQTPPAFTARPAEEPEKLIVEDDDEEYTPTLIERVTGFSIAKRNRKKKEATERYEQIAPSFSSDGNGTDDERMNLEIPSFLRRR